MRALGIAGAGGNLYALRDDGALFVLIKRGMMSPATGEPAVDPHWCVCPAVPGTDAAKEQEG